MELSGNAHVDAFAIVTASPNAILAGFAYVEGIGTVTAKGYIQGEEWTPTPFSSDTWTDSTFSTDTWTAISPSTDTWSDVTASANTWTEVSPSNDIWLRQG
jgi:hypothetical protein